MGDDEREPAADRVGHHSRWHFGDNHRESLEDADENQLRG